MQQNHTSLHPLVSQISVYSHILLAVQQQKRGDAASFAVNTSVNSLLGVNSGFKCLSIGGNLLLEINVFSSILFYKVLQLIRSRAFFTSLEKQHS